MRKLLFGLLGSTVVIAVACSSFDGSSPPSETPNDGGPLSDSEPTVDASVPDADAGEDGGPHATPSWIVALGGPADDALGGLAVSGGSVYASTTYGTTSKVTGSVSVFQGASVIKLHADTGLFADAVFRFAPGNDPSSVAGPIVATSSFIFTSGSHLSGGTDPDVALRVLSPSDLTQTSTFNMDVQSAGAQYARAATADGANNAMFALQTIGLTSFLVNGTTIAPNQPNSSNDEPGIVGMGTSNGTTPVPFFFVDSDQSAAPTGIAVDSAGHVVIAGWYLGNLQTPGPTNTAGPPAADDEDAYLLRMSRDGGVVDRFLFGGGNKQRITSLALDKNDRYVAGTFVGGLTYGGPSLPPVMGTHGFAAKVDENNKLAWIVDLGAVSGNFVGIAADGTRVIVTGTFSEKAKFGTTELVSNGPSDIFVASLNPSTGEFRSADRFGATNTEVVTAITTDFQGTFFVGGTFDISTGFDAPATVISAGLKDMFVLAVKY